MSNVSSFEVKKVKICHNCYFNVKIFQFFGLKNVQIVVIMSKFIKN